MDTEQEDFGFETAKVPWDAMPKLIEASRIPCTACGKRSTLWPHQMCKAKCRVLHDMGKRRRRDEWLRVEQSRGLLGLDTKKWSTTEYRASAYATYMDYFGLVNHKKDRKADWQISRRGVLFLKGELAVPKKILTIGGNVHYESIEEVFWNDVKDVDLGGKAYWDNYPMDDILGLV